MSRVYMYKLTTDNNGAPCLDAQDKLLSLSICKPMIRSTAKVDDLIFGFAAKSLHSDNRLIYIAHVTEKLCNGDYYKTSQYFEREDCIYEWNKDHFQWRLNAKHHSQDDLEHDIGKHPNYERAYTLLSEDFRYFCEKGNDDYKNRYPTIKEAIEKLGRGHRVNHVEKLKAELLALKEEVWRQKSQQPSKENIGQSCKRACHREVYGSILQIDEDAQLHLT